MRQRNVIIVLSCVSVLLALSLLFVALRPTVIESSVQEEIVVQDEQEVPSENQENVEAQERVYEDSILTSEISFSYLNGWHLFSTRYFDMPSRVNPYVQIYLSPDPISVTSPSGGPMPSGRIMISLNEEGEAILAEIENVSEWQEVTKEQIEVNGTTVELVRITTDMSDNRVSYEYPFYEWFHVSAGGLTFRVDHAYADASDAEEPAWVLLKESLRVE